VKNYKVIDLSVKLIPGKESRRLEIRPFIYEADNTIMHDIDTMSHIGTHVEMPSHYSAEGKDVSKFPPDIFIGEGLVLHLEVADDQPITPEILDKASNSDVRRGDIVFLTNSTSGESNPYLSEEASKWLLDKGIKLLGFDNTIGVEPPGKMTTHEIILKNDIPMIENLAHLNEVKQLRVFLIALPLFIEGLDASPLRAVALIEED